MSVGSGVPYNAYTGNGLTTVFAYGFTLLDADDLVVTIGGVVTSAYTVSGVGVAAGGSITFSSAPANGAAILLQRVIQLVRTTEYQSNGDLQAETVNDDFDRLWTAVQQVSDVQGRSIRAPIPDSLTALPAASSRRGLLPVFNATTGDVELSTFTATQVASAVAAAYGTGATADAITFLPAGTGAVARTAQAKMRDSVSVLDFGAVCDGVTDDTEAFTLAFAAHDTVYAPGIGAGYLVSNITLVDGQSLLTDGMATIFLQKSGQAVGTHIIDVEGSNVYVGSCKLFGNISTDTNEQQHAVFVRKAGSTIHSITIGDLYGEDIRGDVLYLGAETGYETKYIRFGRIVGKNILRNVVSIVGASHVIGDAVITDTSTGYTTLDIEPNTLASHDIYVGYVRGGVFQCAPPTLATAAYSIHIGMLDLDPSYAANSTPTYASYEIENAIKLRNVRDITLDHVVMTGHVGLGVQYIFNSGEQRGEAIRIGYLKATNIGSAETTYNCVIFATGVNSLTLDDGDVTLQATADAVILGDSSGSTFTRVNINRLKCDGTVARYIKQGRFSNLLVNTANAVVAFNRCTDCTVIDSDLTIPTLTSFSDRITFISTAATCSTAYYGSSSTGMTRINSSFGGTNVPFATTLAAAAGVTGETVIGGTTGTTVGAAGAASALPANPLGYIIGYVAGTQVKIPYYTA